MVQIFVNSLIIHQGKPIKINYTTLDQKLINELSLKHLKPEELCGIVGIDESRLQVAKDFRQAMKMYTSLASNPDLVRLKLFVLGEVKRILEERLKQYGQDIFATPLPFQ